MDRRDRKSWACAPTGARGKPPLAVKTALRSLLPVLGEFLVAQIPVLPKLHHRQKRDQRTKAELPISERTRFGVAEYEWRHNQPQPAGDLAALFPALQTRQFQRAEGDNERA